MKPYRLTNRLGSGGFVIEATLTLADVPFELDLIDSTPNSPLPEEIADLNPWRQVPVLITPDGKILTECAAMLFYLAEQHHTLRSGPNLFIEDDCRFYRWTCFLASNVYEGILRKSYPSRYATNPDIPSNQLLQAVRGAAQNQTHAALKIIETELTGRSGLCGDNLSPTDIFLAMLFAWHGPQRDLPNCNALTEKIATHPDIAPIWYRNFDHRLDHQWQAKLRA